MGSVKIISDTVQEFNGTRYYKCGYYYQHKGKRLHRAVWEFFNGEIPEGYHVHHLDEDRSNNEIDNLSLIPGIEHINLHAREESRRENGRRAIALAILVAPEWHRSEAGIVFHSKLGKENWAKREAKEFSCEFCGKKFYSKATRARFCNQNCKAKYYRRKDKYEGAYC